MINILVVPSDNIGGVGFYRSTQPHLQLEKQFPDQFSVTIDMNPNWMNLPSFDKYQLIHIHKALYANMSIFYNAMKYFKEKGIVTVMDIDDHWKLSPHHPQYVSSKTYHIDDIIKNNLKIFDYVTTTTPIFAKEISKYNKNVVVIPNAIDPTDPRFAVNKKPSDKLRVGMIMGSSHEYDMGIMGAFVNKLPKDVKDKIQFVLCGFDLRGKMKMINPKTKEATERDLKPQETVWYRYEKAITDNYSIVSEDYKNFLHMFVPNLQYPNVDNEHYKRCWTKDMNHYYEHYSECDVLLAPLEINDFNLVKSQLKVIECCFSKTALIASDFGPYKLDLINAFEKGGTINPEGNALLVDETKNHKQWVKFITKLANDPELVKQLQENIAKLADKFDLRNVTKDRADFYLKIVNGDKQNL